MLYKYVLFLVLFVLPFFSLAQNVNDLKSKIDDTSSQIKKLEDEISSYNKEIVKTSQEANSLKNAIKILDTTGNKLEKDLNLTNVKINKTNLTLEDISETIKRTQKDIKTNSEALKELLNSLKQKEDTSFVEAFLSYKTFMDFYNEIDNVDYFQRQVRLKKEELKNLNQKLNINKEEKEKEKEKLTSLKVDLSDKKKLIEQNKNEKNSLLVDTKNKESQYKKILAEKQAQKDAFEKELFEYESKLRYEMDPSSVPKARSSILSWPLDDVYITQKFGKTNASKRLYVSGSHNGVDFRASVGTPVKASLYGVVVGTGDTDVYKNCYSFGRWVMIKHPNGLSTIYAHLSVIKAYVGQEVKTGDVIGLSGNTGYSTGAHLHLGLYATDGVRIEKYVNSRSCKQAVLPIADVRAYLDPMLYLPNAN